MDQCHLRVQRAGAEVGGRAALAEHAGFGIEHRKVGGETGLVALHRHVVGLFGRQLRLGLLGLLPRDGLQAADLVGHVANGGDDGAVVGFDGGVQVSRLAAQVGAQAAGVEQRQADGGAHAVLLAAGLEQPVQADAGQAGKGDEVDVGIELCRRAGHVLRGGVDAPARGRNVGTPAQQVGGHRGGQRHGLHRLQARAQRGQRVRRLRAECGQRVARQRDLLVQRLDLLARFGQRAFALAQLETGVEPGLHALADERQDLIALRQRTGRDLALFDQPRQRHVAARDRTGEQLARGQHLGLRGTLAAQRGLQRSLVATEEVELPRRIGLQRARGFHRPGQRRQVQAIGGKALARQVERTIYLQAVGRLGDFHRSLGPAQASLRELEVGVAGQRTLDQVGQCRVAQA